MTYATRADLEARFGAEEASDLAGMQDGRIESVDDRSVENGSGGRAS